MKFLPFIRNGFKKGGMKSHDIKTYANPPGANPPGGGAPKKPPKTDIKAKKQVQRKMQTWQKERFFGK